MSAPDLEMGEKLLGEATPGPWKDGAPQWHRYRVQRRWKRPINAPDAPTIGNIQNEADAKLITWMRNNLPALLATARRVSEMEGAAREAYQACMSAWSCGEPAHRVKTMLDKMDALGTALGEPGAPPALAGAATKAEG